MIPRLLFGEIRRGVGSRGPKIMATIMPSSLSSAPRTISTGSNGSNNNFGPRGVGVGGAPVAAGCGPMPVSPPSTTHEVRCPSEQRAGYRTGSDALRVGNPKLMNLPGSVAFADCEYAAVRDLFHDFARHSNPREGPSAETGGVDEGGSYLCAGGVRNLLESIGERSEDDVIERLFRDHDVTGDGRLHLQEFLAAADDVLGGAPARIVLVVGGPGSGKGLLCDRLQKECAVVHMSSGDMLRDEVERDTPLGRECAAIMARGELVSSAVITALVRRRMREYPGRRVLLDGFPRSLDNATDFMQLCGTPELALHLDCDDTILMERIIKRAKEGDASGARRSDDNVDTALRRLRTFHKYHRATMEWLREQHVPVVNLDCSSTPENVWQQLLAIGRLMRPVANPGGKKSQQQQAGGLFGAADESSSAAGRGGAIGM